MDAQRLINTDRFPIFEGGENRAALVKQVQADLADDGCAVLKGFASEAGLASMLKEANGVAHRGHKSTGRTNAYFTQDDHSLPIDHPRRQFFDRSNCFVPADNFAPEGPLRSLYEDDVFSSFIKDCLQEDTFFPYADPLADVIVNAAEEGNGFPWHFDTNNFTVTLALQNADDGGAFEYAPNVRKGDENFAEVARVLDGSSDQVKTLHLEPGDLQIFRGRYSLHRVAPLSGPTPRYVAIFSWVDQPDMVATPERCKQLYGRVLPIHYERVGLRSDEFID